MEEYISPPQISQQPIKQPSFIIKVLKLVWLSCSSCSFIIVCVQILFLISIAALIFSFGSKPATDETKKSQYCFQDNTEVETLEHRLQTINIVNGEDIVLELDEDEVNKLLIKYISSPDFSQPCLKLLDRSALVYLTLNNLYPIDIIIEINPYYNSSDLILGLTSITVGKIKLPKSLVMIIGDFIEEKISITTFGVQDFKIKDIHISKKKLVIVGNYDSK